MHRLRHIRHRIASAKVLSQTASDACVLETAPATARHAARDVAANLRLALRALDDLLRQS